MKTITGQFLRPDGSPASGAILELLLSQDAVATSPMAVVIHGTVSITLDANGNIPPNQQIEGNDELNPQGTFYHVKVLDGTFGKCFDERLVLQGSSPINLNAIAPPLIPS